MAPPCPEAVNDVSLSRRFSTVDSGPDRVPDAGPAAAGFRAKALIRNPEPAPGRRAAAAGRAGGRRGRRRGRVNGIARMRGDPGSSPVRTVSVVSDS
jgi:hypothetical protein